MLSVRQSSDAAQSMLRQSGGGGGVHRCVARKRPGDGYHSPGPHQAYNSRLMMLLLSVTQSISCYSSRGEHFLITYATIPRLSMPTLVSSLSYVGSHFFSPLSARAGICDGFLCILTSQWSVLIDKICRCGIVVLTSGAGCSEYNDFTFMLILMP